MCFQCFFYLRVSKKLKSWTLPQLFQRHTAASFQTFAEYFACDGFSESTFFFFIPDPLHPLWLSDKTPLQILQQLFSSMLNVRINPLHTSSETVLVNDTADKRVLFNAVYVFIFLPQPHHAFSANKGVEKFCSWKGSQNIFESTNKSSCSHWAKASQSGCDPNGFIGRCQAYAASEMQPFKTN